MLFKAALDTSACQLIFYMRANVMHQIQLHHQHIYMMLITFWNVDRYNSSSNQCDVVSVYLVVICYQTALLGYIA